MTLTSMLVNSALKGLTRLRRTPFHIVVGRPFCLRASETRATRQVRQEMVDEIMYQIAALLPPAYRGYYNDLAAATESHLHFPATSESNLRRAQGRQECNSVTWTITPFAQSSRRCSMAFLPLEPEDQKLIAAAADVLRRNYHPARHSVGAAVLCGSGRIYVGINVEACGYGPCAEPIAIGTALTNGERDILACVAVCRQGDAYAVLSPCGNCRQLLLDYAPEAMVIFDNDGPVVKAPARELLPGAYRSDFDNA